MDGESVYSLISLLIIQSLSAGQGITLVDIGFGTD